MWEVLERTPLGRLSMRKFIVLLATLAVVSFSQLFIGGDAAHAADATWDKDLSSQMQRVNYAGKLFEGPFTATNGDGTRLEQGSFYYVNKKDEKAYVVYFAPGTSPPEATSATYQEYDYKNASYSNPSNKKTISITPQETEQRGELTTCSVEGVGWIVCPVTRYLAKGMDWIYSIISDFLKVQPLQSVQTNALYQMWEIGRNFANILFTIGFLILIYGQISGGLLNNYTIKKMLPRIIVAAVLVNISYWICAVGIDVSNILGYAVQDLFISVRESITNTPMQPISWENATEVILTAGTAGVATGVLGAAAFMATGGSIAAAVFLLLPALVGVILAALVALIVLAMRQALITILVIIAPLAFVAYLLPNTEKWFERWRGTFMTMLLLFPIFSLIFGGSQLAGTAIIMTAPSPAVAILGMVVMVAPLVITPLVIKFSGTVLGRIAGMINNPNKGLIDRTRNFANPRAEMYKNRNLARANTGVNRFGAGRVARKMYRGQVNREKRAEGYKKDAENRAHEWEARRLNNGPERLRTFANNYQSRKDYGYWDEQSRRADHKHHEIDAHHQSQWDQRFQSDSGRFDASLLAQEAQTRKYAKSSEVAKSSLDATIREMEAGKNIVTADQIALNVQGVKAREKVSSQLGGLSTSLQTLDRELIVEKERKSAADSVVLGQIAEMYDKNQKIRATDSRTALERAGGIDDSGSIKVRAQAKTNLVKLYMENVGAVNSILSNEGYEAQEQIDIIEKKVLRNGEKASDMHVYAALDRTLTKNGNNWSAQKIIDYAATKGMEATGDGKYRGYDDAGQLVELSDEEVSNRRDFQQMVLEYISKSPLKVDYMSATMKSKLETGTFMTQPGKVKSEDLILSEVNGGTYDQQRVVNADVDVLQRMVQVFRDPNNRTANNQEARKKLMDAILDAQANPQINATIKDRERGVMNTLVSYLDDSDTRNTNEKERIQHSIRNSDGQKVYSRINASGQLERITENTPGAVRESITVQAPQSYSIDKIFDS